MDSRRDGKSNELDKLALPFENHSVFKRFIRCSFSSSLFEITYTKIDGSGYFGDANLKFISFKLVKNYMENNLQKTRLEKLKRIFIKLSEYQKKIQKEEKILKKLKKEYEEILKTACWYK